MVTGFLKEIGVQAKGRGRRVSVRTSDSKVLVWHGFYLIFYSWGSKYHDSNHDLRGSRVEKMLPILWLEAKPKP